MQALVIGVLVILLFLAINAAVWAAAPFIAVAIIVGASFFLFSKEKKKQADESDRS